MTSIYIGEAAKSTGASIKAIRLYEELGLLTHVNRVGKYRVYNEEQIVLIRLIVRAKALGFKLAEMKQFVLSSASRKPWLCILEMIQNKQASLALEIEDLNQKQSALSNYSKEIQQCLADNPDCNLEQGI